MLARRRLRAGRGLGSAERGVSVAAEILVALLGVRFTTPMPPRTVTGTSHEYRLPCQVTVSVETMR
jgi:hypothetical protein